MKFRNIFVFVCLTFVVIGNVFAQELNPTPTEAQGRQVISSTPIKTCVNYGDVPSDEEICPDCPPEPCSECQENGGSATSSDGNTVTAQDSQGVLASYSKIDVKFNHVHIAKEYNSLTNLPGCNTCGGEKTNYQKHLSSLYLNRYHRFRDITEQSSFGPGVFSNYDMSLTLSV